MMLYASIILLFYFRACIYFASEFHFIPCMLSNKFLFLFGSQVVRCCLEHAASVAKTFLTSDAVVVEIKEPETVAAGNPMANPGF